jgi:hypothetical protein
VGLAVWDALEANPWAGVPAAVLREHGLAGGPGGLASASSAPAPGPFVLGDESRLRELLEEAGFAEIEIRPVDVMRRHASAEEFWDVTLDLSSSFHDAVMSQPLETIEELRRELTARLQPFAAPDGTLAVPTRTLLARAEA